MAVTPILMEMIERHDERSPNEAERGTKQLWDIGVRGDDFRGAVARCVNRGQSKLADVRAALDPIRDKAVPERVFLQTQEHEYVSVLETLNEYLSRDWNPVPAASAMSMGPGMGGGSVAPYPMRMTPRTGGFPRWILAPVIFLVVFGGLFVAKGRQFLSKSSAATSASVTTTTASAPVSKAGSGAASRQRCRDRYGSSSERDAYETG